jgi:predicted esterase
MGLYVVGRLAQRGGFGVQLAQRAGAAGTVAEVVVPAAVPAAVPPPAPVLTPLVEPGAELTIGDFFVHIPPAFSDHMRVLVALHGMGGRGSDFCQALLARADREGWVVVAPTFAYGDWRDPNQVSNEESSRFIPRLHDFLLELPERTGLPLEPRVTLYGFSRGAQLAQRFAMIYPEQTLGVAALSAGTYTLPLSRTEVNGQAVTLRYPFGTADVKERFGREFNADALRGIPFWVAVGADDRNSADVPRQWDPYLGNNRVARAEAFAQWLQDNGVRVQLSVFPGVGHAMSDEERMRALDFFASLEPAR